MACHVRLRERILTFRLFWDGHESQETTGLRDTPRNRAKAEAKAKTISDEMAEGTFDYLRWFPDGSKAQLFRPAPPRIHRVPTVTAYAEGTWLPRSVPPAVRASLKKTRWKHWRPHIKPAFGEKSFSGITTAALLNFRALLTRSEQDGGKGLLMSTARDIIDSTFRAMYRDARTIDYAEVFGTDAAVMVDPFAAIRWPRKVTPKPDPFTEEERDLILAYFWEKDRHYYPLVFTLFFTGLRTGEAVGLRNGDLDLRHGRLTVRWSRTLGEDNPPKTQKSERTIKLRPEVVAVHREMPKLMNLTDRSFAFTTQAGTSLDEEKFVEKHWHRALRAKKVRPRKFYATRHTFITLSLENGANIKKLADYCGTSVEMIEKHYAAWMGDQLTEDEMANLGGAVTRPTRTHVPDAISA